MSQPTPIPEDIGEYLQLDPVTGKLWWIKKPSQNVNAGDEAFTADANGYRRGKFRGRPFFAHRVGWFLHYGEQPPVGIDHINGDTSDNRPENLRAACHRLNNRNSRVRKDSSTGVKGIRVSRHSTFQGKVRLDGKMYYTAWYPDIAEAEIAVRQLREQLHGDFTNHG